MNNETGKILAIGNALVDVITHVPASFLDENKLLKSSMTLMEAATAQSLYNLCPPAQEASGGSAANTAAIASALGADAAFIGKVANDQLGTIFKHDMKAQGVSFDTKTLANEINKTGLCLSLVTPDHQRTMCTALGSAQHLEPDDIPVEQIRNAEIVFLESYLLDSPAVCDIFRHVADHVEGKIALTLSDAMCATRHHEFLMDFISQRNVHFLFGNAEEVSALFGRETLEGNLFKAAEHVAVVFCTDGPNGAYALRARRLKHFSAVATRVIDTTGAGDSFAGAILASIISGHTIDHAMQVALAVASEIVATTGARPACNLLELLEQQDLIATV